VEPDLSICWSNGARIGISNTYTHQPEKPCADGAVGREIVVTSPRDVIDY
jgi:hypothetical protein